MPQVLRTTFSLMTEEELIRRLEKIERLFAAATTPGEREAASSARDRLRLRFAEFRARDEPVEFRFTMGDVWSRKLFVALLRRYEVVPYRYPRQKRTTVMARVPKSFVDNLLWPEFQELNGVLKEYIAEVTERIIREQVFEDSSEASVVEEPRQLRG
jgi:hypothetical protein